MHYFIHVNVVFIEHVYPSKYNTIIRMINPRMYYESVDSITWNYVLKCICVVINIINS